MFVFSTNTEELIPYLLAGSLVIGGLYVAVYGVFTGIETATAAATERSTDDR